MAHTIKVALADYDHALPPLHPHNARVAASLRWTYDKDFDAYRDEQGFVLLQEAPPQTNSVDCWR
jgi:hypothetical protein